MGIINRLENVLKRIELLIKYPMDFFLQYKKNKYINDENLRKIEYEDKKCEYEEITKRETEITKREIEKTKQIEINEQTKQMGEQTKQLNAKYDLQKFCYEFYIKNINSEKNNEMFSQCIKNIID
jgi:hypothetical protein